VLFKAHLRIFFHALNKEALYLDGNHILGQLPSEVGLLTDLIDLRLSHQMITGTVPTELKSCMFLEMLYLDNNLLEGSLPSLIGSISLVRDLQLYQNVSEICLAYFAIDAFVFHEISLFLLLHSSYSSV
jgi:hypothetical protein